MRSSTYTDDGDWKVGGKEREFDIWFARATDDSLDHILRFSAKERTDGLLRGADPDSRDARELFLDPQFYTFDFDAPINDASSSSVPPSLLQFLLLRRGFRSSALAVSSKFANYLGDRDEHYNTELCLSSRGIRRMPRANEPTREVGALQIEKANRGCVVFFLLTTPFPRRWERWISRRVSFPSPFLLSVSRSCANFGYLVR